MYKPDVKKAFVDSPIMNEQIDFPEFQFESSHNIFCLKEANNWIRDAKERSAPKMLFGEFWLEGELSILFADTGKGKSVLAVQIAESIARGVPIPPLELSAEPQTILYFDFELTEKQFEARYSTLSNDGDAIIEQHRFSRNLLRAEMSPSGTLPADFKDLSDFLTRSFEELLEITDAKVVIVDNITYLNNSTTNASAALRLMKALRHIKLAYGISILVLAHTPKRHFGSTLTVNDLQGSKMLANFADNIFAMGASFRQKDLRYLKHIKIRNMQLTYDASNVCLFRLEKKGSFLGFTFAGTGCERDHLQWHHVETQTEREELKKKARLLSADGKTQRSIAAELGVSIATVNRYLR